MAARRRPRARLRSAGLAGAVVLALATAAASATVASATPAPSGSAPAAERFVGQVTDALRTPTHRLLASSRSGRAAADLVFVDRAQADTSFRACVRRTDVPRVRTCFADVTGPAGVATVTPLRFPRGSYAVRWRVDGAIVARWRFAVV